MNKILKSEYEKLSLYFNARVVDYHIDYINCIVTIHFRLDEDKEDEYLKIDDFKNIISVNSISESKNAKS